MGTNFRLPGKLQQLCALITIVSEKVIKLTPERLGTQKAKSSVSQFSTTKAQTEMALQLMRRRKVIREILSYEFPFLDAVFRDDGVKIREWPCLRSQVKELQALNDFERESILIAARGKHAKKAEAGADSVRFYNRFDAAANFARWGKAPAWALAEAIALVLGKCPDMVNPCTLMNADKKWPFMQRYVLLSDYVERAKKIGDLSEPIRPADFLTWMKHFAADFPIPKNLEEIIANSAGIAIEKKLINPDPINSTDSNVNVVAEADNEIRKWDQREIRDPRDPEPAQAWYTTARFLARQLVSTDSSLLNKRDLLAYKTAEALEDRGVRKRGGKRRFQPGTVKKALSNISLG